MVTDYIALAIPVFFLLIGIELLVAWLQRRKLYRLNDSINDLSTGMIQQMFGIFTKVLTVGIYYWVFAHAALFELSATSWVVWALCFLGIDFAYYWFHRLSHEVNFLWAAHVVHHQSEEYNLTVALRQSAFQGLFSMVFYWPLAVIGFPPEVFAVMIQFNTLYQFWIHTRTVGTLGPLEWILMTPSHHRVHHGRNPRYIDKNHGATLIIWDKLFGTFEPESEEVYYGITTPLSSWNPVWANLHYWIELGQMAGKSRSLKDKLLVFLKPPGWRPDYLGGFQAAPELGDNPVKFDVPFPKRLGWYVALQFGVCLGLTAAFLFTYVHLSLLLQVAAALVLTWSLVNFGFLMEGRMMGFYLEFARMFALPLTAFPFIEQGAPHWLAFVLLGNLVLITQLQRVRPYFLKAGRMPRPVPA